MRLISLTDPAAMLDAGLPFRSTDQARWEFRNAAERGTEDAFVRIGRRIYIDPDAYHKLIRAHHRDHRVG